MHHARFLEGVFLAALGGRGGAARFGALAWEARAGRALDAEAESRALLGFVAEREGLPTFVRPDYANEGRMGDLEEKNADFLGGGFRDDPQEGLEQDDGDEVLSWVSMCSHRA